MITFVQGHNIFYSDTETIVCPVNTVGVMGNGLACAFRLRYKGLYDAYAKACKEGVFHSKGYFVYETLLKKKILCFPTKRHWHHDSQIEWIRKNLNKLAETYKEEGITDITFPAIGSGKGNLPWAQVKPVIIECLAGTDMEITVIEPEE